MASYRRGTSTAHLVEKQRTAACPTIRFLDYRGEKGEKRDAAKKAGKKAKTVLDAVEIEAPVQSIPSLNPAAPCWPRCAKGWNGDRDLALVGCELSLSEAAAWAAVSPRVWEASHRRSSQKYPILKS